MPLSANSPFGSSVWQLSHHIGQGIPDCAIDCRAWRTPCKQRAAPRAEASGCCQLTLSAERLCTCIVCKAYQFWPHQVPHQVHPNCNAGSTAGTHCAIVPLLQVWSVPSQRFQFTLSGHSNWVRACQFSPDGRLAVSGGDDKTVRVWDIPTRQCIRIYDDHSGHVNTVAFHPDGTCIASGGTDDAIKVHTEHEPLGQVQLLLSSMKGQGAALLTPCSAQDAVHRGRALPQGAQTLL